MNGTVARRNDPAYWAGKPTWTRVRANRLPQCEDCLLNVHDSGGQGSLAKARWRRQVADAEASVLLCDRHKTEWERWTPGQLVIG